MFAHAFKDKTVWLSGHTGFKGSWLAHWLLELGARVYGFSLPPPTEPALFDQLSLAPRVQHELADLRDATAVKRSLLMAQPDFVFHLAAQPLVRLSHELPVETYATNVMGTVHLLEALRELRKPCATVLITSDKCYENREWVYGYREDDPLGGSDPYSSSKAACEIAISAWRRSFFSDHPVQLASARAGNVIGGGDWAKDRILPDCVRALQAGEPIGVRNKSATRPWQHVLEPLSGYLWLAANLAHAATHPETPNPMAAAFNFGPTHESNRTVAELVAEVLKHWPGRWEERGRHAAIREAHLLQLTVEKAAALLGWSPVWSFPEAVQHTVEWYRTVEVDTASAAKVTSKQIATYTQAARQKQIAWAIVQSFHEA